jgi:hypothetical protein
MVFWIRNTPDHWTLTRGGETLATLRRRRDRWIWRVGLTGAPPKRGGSTLKGIAGSLDDAIRLVSLARTGLRVGYSQRGPQAA